MEIHVKSKYKTRPIIGMFINNLFNEYSFLIHKGVKTKVYDSGGILICFMGGSLNNPFHSYNQRGAVYNLAQSKSLDGLIILSSSIGSYIERKHYESFINTFDPLPIVNIGKIIDGYFNVKANNYHSMCELVTHCIKKHGCKKIAMIKGPEKNEDAVARFKAYKDILKKYNISYNPDLVINGSFYADFGRTAVIQLLDHRKAEFDALLCSNDYVAVTAIQELKRRGLRVPQDIIITGYDNIQTCRHIHMPLTTVHQPCFELGYQAAEYLCSLLDGNKNQTSIELPSRFIARQSCGCKEQEATTEYINMQSSSSGIRLNMLDITLSGFKKKITNIMHFHELEETMYQSFPQFAVKSCFIFVYDAAKTAHTSVSPMLLLGYENYKLLDAGSHNVRVVHEQIIPFCKQRINHQDIVYIYALVHGEKLLGYAVYAIDAKEDTCGISTRYNDGSLCELLTQELAAALNSVNDYKKCKKVENTGSNVQHTLNSNYSNGYKLSGDQEEQYFNSIISFMEKEKPYINDDLSLYDLARETDIPRSYLSYVINKYAGVNFYDFLHKYRVKEAKTILSDKRYNDLRILEIAYNCGFKAKSTFNKIFKKQTGMTPSDFKKQKKILVKG